MEWLSKIRYVLAVMLYAGIPPALLYWYLIHPFAGYWRRVGVRKTFLTVGAIFLLVAAGLASQHHYVLARSYPFRWPLAAVGLALYAVAAALEVACRRHLKFPILAGVPEIGEDSGRLLTEGIYSRVRNPRYLSILLGTGGLTLILNYPALYLFYLASVPAAPSL